jgi:N-carbamoyl-L-amino-acid hydrolase
VGTGSHIDAIPNAGLYDGCVGVLGGLEAIRVLQKLGFRPRRSIELVIFTSEEPTRFGIGCLGSRMMSGVLSPADAAKLHDKEGRGLEALRIQAGFSGSLESVALPAGRFHQFVELHIEQGPTLEAEGLPRRRACGWWWRAKADTRAQSSCPEEKMRSQRLRR